MTTDEFYSRMLFCGARPTLRGDVMTTEGSAFVASWEFRGRPYMVSGVTAVLCMRRAVELAEEAVQAEAIQERLDRSSL